MFLLTVRPDRPASAVYRGETCPCDEHNPACFPVSAPAGRLELAFELWPAAAPFFIPVPEMHSVVLYDGKPISASVRIIDWGHVIEALPRVRFFPDHSTAEHQLLSTAELSGRTARLIKRGTYTELTLQSRAEVRSVSLNYAEHGSLRTVDFGSARLLCVQTRFENTERFAVFNEALEPLLDVAGVKAGIENGVPVLIESLDACAGHERRTAYDLKGGEFRVTEESIGFFTHPAREPAADTEKAVMLFEAAKLGSTNEMRTLSSPRLSESMDANALLEFTGPYDRVWLSPIETPEGEAKVGLTENNGLIIHPRLFGLSFENGLIADISEL